MQGFRSVDSVILIALPPVLIGIGAIAVGSGFDVPLEGMTAPPKAVAIVSPEFTLKSADLPSQVRDASVTLRVTPTDGSAPLFIGLAASEDVKRYRVYVQDEVDEARRLRAETPASVVGGERNAVRIEGFDVGVGQDRLRDLQPVVVAGVVVAGGAIVSPGLSVGVAA